MTLRNGIRIDKSTLALAVLIKHPHYTNMQIAALVGCTRHNLEACRQYRMARATLKAQRFARGTGYVDKRTGNLEAFAS